MGRIITVTGPSGSGKTSLIQAAGFAPVVSVTTRSPRASDPVGEYEYITDSDFDKMVADEHFAWHVRAHNNRYGTRKESLYQAWESSKDFAMPLVPSAVEDLHSISLGLPIVPIYLAVLPQTLAYRLQKRGDTDWESRLKAGATMDQRVAKSHINYILLPNEGPIEETAQSLRRILARGE